MKTNRFCSVVGITLFLLFALLALEATSATFSLNPGADAFVTTGPSGTLSTDNFGGAGALSVAAPGLPQGEFQSILQFGLSGAKSSFDTQFGIGQWSIQSITLQLTAAPRNNNIFNVTAAGLFAISWMQNNSWTEGTGTPAAPGTTGITFSTLSNFVGSADELLGTFGFNGATNGAATYTLNLTPSFSADVLAGGTVSLRMFAADSVVSDLSDSRNFTSALARPLLTVTAIPEPGALALAGFGLCLLAGRRLASRRNPQ